MKLILSIAMVAMIGLFTACEDDETAADPFASFQYSVSEDNKMEVSFTNTSENAESYKWAFGDGETSTEANPVHIYSETGTYEVVLTATNADGVSTEAKKTIDVGVATLLAGDSSKTWKLIREGTSMGVGPDPENARSWWSLENDGSRPCVYKHEFIFHADGTFEFDDNGIFWGEEAVFEGTDVFTTCFEATPANMVNSNGDDVSAWLSGTYEYDYDKAAGKVTLNGNGAWMGMPQLGTDGESITPVATKTFDATIEEKEGYDLMTISYYYEEDNLYWDFTYVSYDDWANEPDLVVFMVDFDYTVNDYTVTFENLSADATSYTWNFGDGTTSTKENPTHTYDAEGTYDVVLTATNADGDTKEITKSVTISLNPTEAAPTPTEDEANVISIYSDAYTDISDVNLDPNWGQATVTEEIEIATGEMALKMSSLDYQGIDWATNAQDVSGKDTVHVDVYCSEVTDINFSLIGGGAENPVTLTTEEGVWKSFDIALSEYTEPDLTAIIQVKFDDAGTGASPTIFVDNIYFY